MSYVEHANDRAEDSPLTVGERVICPDGFGYVADGGLDNDRGRILVAPVRLTETNAKYHEREDVERVPDEEWINYDQSIRVANYDIDDRGREERAP